MFLKSGTSHGYFPVDDNVFTVGFYLTGAGAEHVEPHETYPLPSHPDMYEFSWNTGRVLPEYQLVYIGRGEGVFESRETGLVNIQGGMAMLLLPNVWHRYRPKPKTGWDEHWISFNGQIPHIWQQAGLLDPASAIWQTSRTKALANGMKQIVKTAIAKTGDPFAASCAALALLAGLFGSDAKYFVPLIRRAGASKVPCSDDAVTHAALRIIWNYSHRHLSVSDIARQLGIARRTLERRFLAARKRTVLEELTACRLARAQRMLRETHLPIKHIAYAAGFSSPTHLPTVFQRELNMTPQQYRAGAVDTAIRTPP